MMSPLHGKLLMLEEYDINYGICDHDDAHTPPLALMSVQPAEDVEKDSDRLAYTRRYVIAGIKDIYGLNLQEFMNLPRDYAEELLDEAAAEKQRRQQREEAAQNSAERAANSSKGGKH